MSKPITSDPRPHLIPGIYSWLAENFAKVHMAVLIDHPQFSGPPGLPTSQQMLAVANAEDCANPITRSFNIVTLNVGMNAIGKFHQDDSGIEVEMRFGGTPRMIYIPFDAIVSVYSPDNTNVQAFDFILRPGSEEFSIGALKKEVIRVEQPAASNDVVKPKPAFARHAEFGAPPRPNHLKLVKS